MSLRSLSRWLLLLILNAYILYTIFGLIVYAVVVLPTSNNSRMESFIFGAFTFQREINNNVTSYYLGVSDLTPKMVTDSVVLLKNRLGETFAAKKDESGKGFLMPVSKSQYRILIYTYVAYSVLMISMFIYLMILLVQFTRRSMTHLFRDAQNGKRLRRIGILLLLFECIQLFFPLAVRFLPGLITGYTGFGVSLNLPASTGLPYGIVAGLLLIIISDAFDQNDE